MKQSRDWRRLALGGAIQSLTVVPGNIAWGLAFGAAAGAAGIPAATSALFSAVAFSGTAQMATLGLLHGPLVAIFGTSLLVSLRFVPMTLYLAVEMAAQPRWRRALAAATMADASFAVHRSGTNETDRRPPVVPVGSEPDARCRSVPASTWRAAPGAVLPSLRQAFSVSGALPATTGCAHPARLMAALRSRSSSSPQSGQRKMRS